MADDEWEYLEKASDTTAYPYYDLKKGWVRAPSFEALPSVKKRMEAKADTLGKEHMAIIDSMKKYKKRLMEIKKSVLKAIPKETAGVLDDDSAPSGEYAHSIGEHIFTFRKSTDGKVQLKVTKVKPF